MNFDREPGPSLSESDPRDTTAREGDGAAPPEAREGETRNLYEMAEDRERLAALAAFRQRVAERLPDSVLARRMDEMLAGLRLKDRELIEEQRARTYGREAELQHMEQLRVEVDIAIERLTDPDQEIARENLLVQRFRRGGTTRAGREFAEERLRMHEALLEDARRLKSDLEAVGGAEDLHRFLREQAE